jgi:polysaccharide export outer membrane protein
MRTRFLPALPLLTVLVGGVSLAQEQQVKPPVGTVDPADAARLAADKGDAKAPVGGAPVDSSYEIGPEDVITVWVYQQPSMSGQYVVRTDGMVSVPLIGEFKAGGLTTSQAEAVVINKLKTGEIVIDPNVTVNVWAVHSKKIYISGDGIARTGSIDLVVATHVSEAIAAMGGFRDFAKKSKIRIVRPTADGKAQVFYYNDNQVSHGKKLEQNILLKAGDHIYVD